MLNRPRNYDCVECSHNTHPRNMKMDYETEEQFQAREEARKRDEERKKSLEKEADKAISDWIKSCS